MHRILIRPERERDLEIEPSKIFNVMQFINRKIESVNENIKKNQFIG